MKYRAMPIVPSATELPPGLFNDAPHGVHEYHDGKAFDSLQTARSWSRVALATYSELTCVELEDQHGRRVDTLWPSH